MARRQIQEWVDTAHRHIGRLLITHLTPLVLDYIPQECKSCHAVDSIQQMLVSQTCNYHPGFKNAESLWTCCNTKDPSALTKFMQKNHGHFSRYSCSRIFQYRKQKLLENPISFSEIHGCRHREHQFSECVICPLLEERIRLENIANRIHDRNVYKYVGGFGQR
jgi:hypothetical protein